MGEMKRGENPDGCFICGNTESATIEFDRPVTLLCECKGCGKFFLKRDTQIRLMGAPDFEKCRGRISRLIRAHFNTHERPLEIILTGEKPRAEFSITVEEMLNGTGSDNF